MTPYGMSMPMTHIAPVSVTPIKTLTPIGAPIASVRPLPTLTPIGAPIVPMNTLTPIGAPIVTVRPLPTLTPINPFTYGFDGFDAYYYKK